MARSFKLRPTAIVPALFSAGAFALALVLAVAGTRPDSAGGFYLLSVNASMVGSQTIRFTPVNTTIGPGDDGGVLGDIGDFFGDLIGGLTETIDNELQNVEEELVNGVVNALGIKDEYTLFLRKICEGTLEDQSDPDSATVTTCHSYDDEDQGFNNITSSVPSSLVVGTTNISVPILASMQGSFSSLQELTDNVTTAIFAFVMIGLITTALVFLLSLVAVILRPNIFAVAALVLALLSAISLFLAAVVATVVATLVPSFINNFGEGLALYVKGGTKFIQFIWISWALSVVASLYWLGVWFVEVRTSSFRRRHRTEGQIGSWRGIFREVKSDFTVEKKVQ